METDLLFRYRPLDTKKRIKYFTEGMKEKKLFTVPLEQLNDISEGLNVTAEFAYAGTSHYVITDNPDPVLLNYVRGYRVLSLCETCFSSAMWANYASDFNGVCLGFWSEYSDFSLAKPVAYDNNAYEKIILNEAVCSDEDKRNKVINQALHIKGEDWAYEKEWRIVYNSDSSYTSFEHDALACIIINEMKIDKTVLKWIVSYCNNHCVPLLSISRCRRPNQLKIKPYSIQSDTGVSRRKALYNVDQLIGYLHAKYWGC